MKHSITALTMLLIQQCPAVYSVPLSLSLSLGRALDSERARIGIDIISFAASVRPRSRVCVHTAFGVAADTRFPPGR